jgi:hypothetical protein
LVGHFFWALVVEWFMHLTFRAYTWEGQTLACGIRSIKLIPSSPPLIMIAQVFCAAGGD